MPSRIRSLLPDSSQLHLATTCSTPVCRRAWQSEARATGKKQPLDTTVAEARVVLAAMTV